MSLERRRPLDVQVTVVTQDNAVSACGKREQCPDNKCTTQKCNTLACDENVCRTQNCDFKGCHKPNQCDLESCTTKARTHSGRGLEAAEGGVGEYLEEQIALLRALEQPGRPV